MEGRPPIGGEVTQETEGSTEESERQCRKELGDHTAQGLQKAHSKLQSQTHMLSCQVQSAAQEANSNQSVWHETKPIYSHPVSSPIPPSLKMGQLRLRKKGLAQGHRANQ